MLEGTSSSHLPLLRTPGGVRNPLFLFSTKIANTGKCSIVIRTTEWEKIRANMPWLLDAVVCVVLDLFVSFYFDLNVLFPVFIYDCGKKKQKNVRFALTEVVM